ncbi:MAG: glycosyltransferase family 39 protein, partial [Anaerolineae bacterium]|nr:glycosyltransferase family 39 protein [Anaerolineae bacterium]
MAQNLPMRQGNVFTWIKQFGPAAAALLLVLAGAFWLCSRYLWANGITYDEGHWLMFGLLAHADYAPYREIFVGIPPLALLVIQLGAALFDVTLAVRYPMMVLSLVGVAALYGSFLPWQGTIPFWSGLLAASILAFEPQFLAGSATILAEAPAISAAIVSFVLALAYQRGGGRVWLFLSGVAFGLSLALKLFAVFLPGVIAVLLVIVALTHPGEPISRRLRRLGIDGLLWSLGVLLPWLILALMYDLQAMFHQIFLFRLSFRELNFVEGEAKFGEHLVVVGEMLRRRWPLLLGAAAGTWLGWRQRRPDIWLWAVWLGLAIVPLIWQAPLRDRYVVMLLPPLAALTGYALACGLAKLSASLVNKGPWLRPVVLLAAVLGLYGVILTPAIRLASARPLADPDGYIFDYLTTERRDAIDFVRTTTFAGDCIITDDQRFAFAADRLVPPWLSETSDARLMARWLIDTDDIIRQAAEYNCPATVYVYRRFRDHLPDLAERLRQLYFLEIAFTDEVRVFTGLKSVTTPPSQPLAVTFGETIALQGLDLTPRPWMPGQRVQLATYWSASQPPPRSYKVFLQLRHDQGEVVASYDHFPF